MSNYALWSVFGPWAWCGWALLIGAVALAFPARRARVVARVSVGLGLAWFFAMFVSPMGFALIEPLETRFPRPALATPPRDVLVLTGGEHLNAAARHHRPEYGETGDRMIAGAMLAHRFPAARLWAVGGVRPTPEAPRDVDWLREAWLRLGLDPRRIVIVGNTDDTCTNARGVAARLGSAARPVLVTSAFHMPRAMGCFRAAGLDPIAYPVDFLNGADISILDTRSPDLAMDALRTELALHEYLGLAYYRLTGRIGELWPGPQPPRTRRYSAR